VTSASLQAGVTRTLLEQLAALRAENDQLRTALQSRIIIEQAKGAISVRCGVTPDRAFHMMRARARSRRQSIHAYAAEIVANGGRFAAEREVS
jgi:AmiR/NasT family two-component response regulator